MKTYKIVDNTVNHPKLGELKKKKIQYFVNGELEMEENYTNEYEVKPGYTETK